ncbi:MAG: SPOR domain-containing protein [Hyphomonadaceae bacterium]|nr:SPOR domain-containing protein [Hyphomonadaceae bacterium]
MNRDSVELALSARYDRMHAYDDNARGAGVIYILMVVIAVCFGGFLWQLYSGPDAPHIPAPAGPYKVQPPPEAANAPDATEQTLAEAQVVESEGVAPAVEEAPLAADAPATDAGPPQVAAAPMIAGNGPFVAQLAALQSEAAVQQAWRRLSSRAPELFASAHLDVERADLGQRGIYYRVRAGYFTDRSNAARFCERIRQMGQDCIVTTR